MIGNADIGGAVVQRPFNMGGRRLQRGDMLTASEVQAMPPNNRRALIDNRQIEVFPPVPSAPVAPHPAAGAEMHVIHRGAGLYDVIRGERLNSEPLSKEQAVALAEQGADDPDTASPAN